MDYKLIALGTGLLVGGMAVAGVPNTNSFPGPLPQMPEAVSAAPGMLRAPLNPQKDAGTKIFGHTVNGWDYDHIVHYVDLYSSNPKNLNKLCDIFVIGNRWDREFPDMLGVYGGAWGGDAYYGHRIVHYSFGITRLTDWVKVDTETGESTQLHLWNESGPDPLWWRLPQAILWNPIDADNLYALHQNDDGTVTSVLAKVDKETGYYSERVKALPAYYMAAAFDYDNQLYALRWVGNDKGEVVGTALDVLDPADDYNVISSTPILVDGKPFKIYYDNNSIAFDHSTGDIWWSAWNIEANNVLVKIDPLTFETESFGYFGMQEGVDGLSIAYEVAEARSAPARVENLNFVKDEAGDNKVTITWTNPTRRWNRRTLSNLSSVEIYRDAYEGEPVATLPATGKEGADMTWTDEGGSQGVHKYYVVPVNSYGKGVPRSIDAFVGKDVPGEVCGLKAITEDGKSIFLTWSKPVRGDNDGWFDDSDLSYTITRKPDNKLIATVKDTYYSDSDFGEAQLFSYSVVASNAQGSGSATESNAVLAGNGIRPPYSTEFQDRVDAVRFTSVDKNGDGRYFQYENNNHLGRETMRLEFSNGGNDDILVTPTLLLEKGKTYKLVYKLYFGGFGDWDRVSYHPIRIVGGTEATANGLSTVLYDEPAHEVVWPSDGEEYTVYVESPVDGEYYFGFELMTATETDMWLYVEGFSIEESPADDLQAVALDGHLYLSSIENNTFNVQVYNNGKNTQSDYKVQLALLDERNQPVVFAETDIVPEIAAYQTDYVELEAAVPALGYQAIVAIVSLEGDGNPSNDKTAPLFANCEEVPALNVTVEDVTSGTTDTNLPMNHYFACTATQTIYTPAMTFFDRIYGGKKPAITRIAWEYESLGEFASFDDTEVAVYLTQTDTKGYDRDNGKFIPVTAEPVFRDNVPFVIGHNYLVADIDDEYEFDPARPLVVTISKKESNHQEYLVKWRTFGMDWAASTYQSMNYKGNGDFDPLYPSGQSYAGAPLIHLSVKTDNSGVDEVVLTGKGAVYYNAATQSVESIDFAMSTVDVYDLGGKLVKAIAVADGDTSAYIGCEKGIYLIKVYGADGTALTLKAKI
ncbi:MAG: T9SS type A sorting domain-containing protein [Muribaculaceae bacterium]|nr:T9SS type A sorting domain-containing protein [Muribaculaceae bacterium]